MTTYEMTGNRVFPRATAGARLRLGLQRLAATLATWHERARYRRELADMPEHLLRDMGIAPDEVYRELRKPFWRA